MTERKTVDRGRDSGSGRFIPVKEAESRPNTTTVDRVPKPGCGINRREPKSKGR